MNARAAADVIVVGSGAAGLVAALAAARRGARVTVLEKSDLMGGTTAISGGWAWVPGNRKGTEEGDTREEILTYLRHLVPESLDEELVGAFLDEVPSALSFIEETLGIDVLYAPLAPDYQMDLPGARSSGRAVTFYPADARRARSDRLRIRPYLAPMTVFGYMPEVGDDIATFLRANREPRAFVHAARKVSKTWIETAMFRRALKRTNGNALITHLVVAARKAGVDIRTSTEVVGLEQDDEGAVTGVRTSGGAGGVVSARRAVVLTTGGFGGDPVMRSRYFAHDPAGTNHVTPTVGHDGDAIRLAEAVGAVVDTRPAQAAGWAPTTEFAGRKGPRRFPHLRAFGLPGLIAIDRRGQRFANESLSYHDWGTELLKNDRGADATTAWIVGDHDAMKRYGIGWAKPWPFPQGSARRSGYLVKAPTIAALAEQIGVPAETLKATVSEFSTHARQGVDPAFGRGSTAFHHFKGDMSHSPNPNLAPIERAPFYAVQVRIGDLGTFVGLAVNGDGAVLDGSGTPVRGLYAAGTAAVSPFGGAYPGFGANIGPALVMGHKVGRSLAEGDVTTAGTAAAGSAPRASES